MTNYEQDCYAWSKEQAELLRLNRFNMKEIDAEDKILDENFWGD